METILSGFFSDIDGNSFTGIAVSANGTTSTQGSWEYSANGSAWVTLSPTDFSAGSALALSKEYFLRFSPTGDYNNTSAEAEPYRSSNRYNPYGWIYSRFHGGYGRC